MCALGFLCLDRPITAVNARHSCDVVGFSRTLLGKRLGRSPSVLHSHSGGQLPDDPKLGRWVPGNKSGIVPEKQKMVGPVYIRHWVCWVGLIVASEAAHCRPLPSTLARFW